MCNLITVSHWIKRKRNDFYILSNSGELWIEFFFVNYIMWSFPEPFPILFPENFKNPGIKFEYNHFCLYSVGFGSKKHSLDKKRLHCTNKWNNFIFSWYNFNSFSYWFNVRRLSWMDDSKLKAVMSAFLTKAMNWWNWSIRIDFDTFWENFSAFLWLCGS